MPYWTFVSIIRTACCQLTNHLCSRLPVHLLSLLKSAPWYLNHAQGRIAAFPCHDRAYDYFQNAMTSNIALSAIAVHLGLHRQISGLTPAIAHAIEMYAVNLDKARRKNQQDSEREGRKLGQYWSNLQGPKVRSLTLIVTRSSCIDPYL